MKFRICFGLLILSIATVARAATNDLTAALQKALFEEEGNRNLDAAVTAYQSLVGEFDKDRRVAATAVFRLGECYRKLGRTNEAAAQYERIVSEFGDQAQLATLSRQNLIGLGQSAPTAASLSSATTAATSLDGLQSQYALLKAQVEQARKETNLWIVAKLFGDETLREVASNFTLARKKVESLKATGASTEEIRSAESGTKSYEDYALDLRKRLFDFQEVRLNVLKSAIEQAGIASQMKNAAEGRETAAASDDEEAEIRRLEGMIRNSPDLINTPSAVTGSGPNQLLLVQAASQGKLRVAAFLLDHGADVQRGAPLSAAARNGHRAMVDLLLKRGADPNPSNFTPLHAAAQKGFKGVAEVLLANGADVNGKTDEGATPLHFAVQGNFDPIVRLLLTNGADVNALFRQWSSGSYRFDAGTPFLIAIQRGDLELVKLFLAFKADLSAKSAKDLWPAGASALDWALFAGKPQVAELLLKAGADAKAPSADGSQPLHFAAGNKASVELLLAAGASVNVTNGRGETPLHWAACCKEQEPAALLIAKGAKINAADTNGWTPLHLAVMADAVEAGKGSQGHRTRLLLENKANPNLRDKDGRTPLDMTKVTGFTARNATSGVTIPNLYAGNVRVLANPGVLVPPPGGASAQQPSTTLDALLKQFGATTDLPELNRIEVRRKATQFSDVVFRKDPNGYNDGFTLLELLAVEYGYATSFTPWDNGTHPPRTGYGRDDFLPRPIENQSRNSNPLPFPDLSRIVIRRPDATGEHWREIKVNLTQAIQSGDCSKDVGLEWGDVVEIPELDHPISQQWTGPSLDLLTMIKNCLRRTVLLTIKDSTDRYTFGPDISIENGKLLGAISQQRFHLRAVLDNSQRLLTSSDLSRVKVKRRDPATGKTREWVLNCDNATPNFWVRDGDEIEVPEK